MEDLLLQLEQSVIDGKQKVAVALTEQLLNQGVSPAEILSDGLVSGMEEVGERFKCGDYFVPEMVIAARAMKSAMQLIRPKLVDTGVKPLGTIVLGTVRGDLHDIGKNLTGMFLEGAGFRVIDIGVDASADKFVAAVKENEAQIVGISALLTTTMPYAGEIIRALNSAGMRPGVKVIVGGAPMTEEFAAAIGADAFAPDAATGADRCKELIVQ